MDWVSLVSAIGFSGILTAVVTGIQNKRINKASANNSDADYSAKILAQADERVAQALSDRDRAMKERDEAYAEAKGQRKSKRDWREVSVALEREKHALQLEVKDLSAKITVLEWHKCEVTGCANRMPPRQLESKDDVA